MTDEFVSYNAFSFMNVETAVRYAKYVSLLTLKNIVQGKFSKLNILIAFEITGKYS